MLCYDVWLFFLNKLTFSQNSFRLFRHVIHIISIMSYDHFHTLCYNQTNHSYSLIRCTENVIFRVNVLNSTQSVSVEKKNVKNKNLIYTFPIISYVATHTRLYIYITYNIRDATTTTIYTLLVVEMYFWNQQNFHYRKHTKFGQNWMIRSENSLLSVDQSNEMESVGSKMLMWEYENLRMRFWHKFPT